MRPGTPDNLPDPQLDPKAFEELIKNRGLRWQHFKATQCPNVDDLENNQHDPNCRRCENGMLYYGGAIIHGIFQQNKLERMYEVQGIWDIGEAVVTFSAYADDLAGVPGKGAAVDLQHFDKLVCLDYQFRWQELIEHSPMGIDRLRYPALNVEFLSTKQKEYKINEDFIIDENGYIKWTTTNRPDYNQDTQRGEVYTVAYCARPVFYVVQLLHEIRATKALNRETNEVEAIRLPQMVLIRRDYLFKHPADDKGEPDTQFPRSGGNVTPQ